MITFLICVIGTRDFAVPACIECLDTQRCLCKSGRVKASDGGVWSFPYIPSNHHPFFDHCSIILCSFVYVWRVNKYTCFLTRMQTWLAL